MDELLQTVRRSFAAQAAGFESSKMNFSKKEYLAYTLDSIGVGSGDDVLEVAAGTCATGRALAERAKSVVCIDATPEMLAVGKAEAEKAGLSNMVFLEGLAEALPFEDGCFDIVVTRLSFHHFVEPEKPFAEMTRVLRPGGKLAVIDMEAAEEALRAVEDEIETLRDPSHVKNRSREELLALYRQYGFDVVLQESTPIPVDLQAWMELTNTPDELREHIASLMDRELRGGPKTGFAPYRKDGRVLFNQRWLLLIGIRQPSDASEPGRNAFGRKGETK